MEPLVSVIIPTFNRKESLEIAINSVLEQTYSNIEIIVTDNASHDGTSSLMEHLQLEMKNKKIKYIRREKNIGPHKNAYNAYKEYANGKYIFFLSDDDYLCDVNFIYQGVQILENNDNISIVTGMILAFLEKHNKFVMQPYYNVSIINGIDFLLNTSTKTIIGKYAEFVGGFALIRKSHLDNNNAFEWLEYGDMVIRFYHLILGDIYFIDRAIGVYLVHENNTGDSNDLIKLEKQIPNICKFIDIVVDKLSELYPDKKELFKEIITKKITDNTIITILYFYMERNNKSQKENFKMIKELCSNCKIKKINSVMYNFIINRFFYHNDNFFEYSLLSVKNSIIDFKLLGLYRDYRVLKITILGIVITIRIKNNKQTLIMGAYVNKDISAGYKIKSSDIYYSLELCEGQVTSEYSINNILIKEPLKKGEKIMFKNIEREREREREREFIGNSQLDSYHYITLKYFCQLFKDQYCNMQVGLFSRNNNFNKLEESA